MPQLTGLVFGEPPRWHHDRLWFSDMGAQQVAAVDLQGTSEIVARVPATPMPAVPHRAGSAGTGTSPGPERSNRTDCEGSSRPWPVPAARHRAVRPVRIVPGFAARRSLARRG